MDKLDEIFLGKRSITTKIHNLEKKTRLPVPSGGHQQIVADGGSVVVDSGGYITLRGQGVITAGDEGGARTEMSFSGVTGYNSSGVAQVQISSVDGGMDILGTGSLRISGGGSAIISGGGGLVVGDTGSVSVVGTGKIIAGTVGAQRTEISSTGLRGYNASNSEQVRLDSTDGKLKILGSGSVVVSTGSIIAGTEGANRLEIKQGGIFAYDALNNETVSISTTDGKVRVDADSFIADGTVTFDSLSIVGAMSVAQNLIVGSNVLQVNTAGQRIGVNRAADPQFDLDVNGSFRAGGYIVGKHAIQLPDAMLIAHFDGAGIIGTNLTGDPTGHKGQKATVTGIVSYPAGKFNKGITINSSSRLEYATSGNIQASSGTISLWFYPTTSGTGILFGHGSTAADYIRLAYLPQLRIQFGAATVTGTTTPALNTWHHVAVTWGSNAVSVYLNGVLEASTTYSTLPTLASLFAVGSDPTSGINRFIGVIDDLVITSSSSTLALVKSIYESNAPVFAETSTWGFKTANTLAWADEEGLWAVDDSGSAAFGVSGVNSKSWGNLGSTLLDKGDILLGNTNNYLLWDASTGKLSLAGQMSIGTTNKLWLNDSNDGGIAIGGTNKALAPFRVNSSGELTASEASFLGGTLSGRLNVSSIDGKIAFSNNNFSTYADGNVYEASQESSSGIFSPAGQRLDFRSMVYGISSGTYTTGSYVQGVEDATGNQTLRLVSKNMPTNKYGTTYVAAQGNSGHAELTFAGGASTGSALFSITTNVHVNRGLVVGDVPGGSLSASTGQIKTTNDVVTNTNIGTSGFVPSGGISVAVGSPTSGLASIGNGVYELRSANNTRVAGVASSGVGIGLNIDPNDAATSSNLSYALRFGAYGSNEAISSPRTVGSSHRNGLVLWTGATARMTVSSAGEVRVGYGIADGTGSTRLSVKGQGTGAGTYSIFAADSTNTTLFYIRDDGVCAAKSSWTILSDLRDKEDVVTLEKNGWLDKLSLLRGIKYKLPGNESTFYGYGAQEVLPIFPELVDIDSSRDRLSVRYGDLIPILVQALGELHTKVQELEAKLAG